jgi:hypothetical protein
VKFPNSLKERIDRRCDLSRNGTPLRDGSRLLAHTRTDVGASPSNRSTCRGMVTQPHLPITHKPKICINMSVDGAIVGRRCNKDADGVDALHFVAGIAADAGCMH